MRKLLILLAFLGLPAHGENVSLGINTLAVNTTGYNLVAIGDSALASNTTGFKNSALGYMALFSNTSGFTNTALGEATLYLNTTGHHNTSIGGHSMYFNTTGSNNTGVGPGALYSNTIGDNNSSLGVNALRYNTTGFNNAAFGYTSLYENTDGYQNSAFGINSLGKNTTGDNNAAFGAESLKQNTIGNSNTAVGTLALYDLIDYTNSTGLGYNAQVTGSNQIQLGNSLTTTYTYGAVQNRSDIRDKYDIRDTQLGLDFINALRPVDFRYDYRENYPNWVSDGSKKQKEIHHGLIAQEVKQVIDAQGVEFGGYRDIAKEGGKDVKTIGYTELIGPLIKAVQELSARVKELEGR